MSTSFDATISLLNGLHEQIAMTDQHDIIEISDERNFRLPEGYNVVVAHVGDVNSQIITFGIPKTYEGHSLHDCDFKQIIWKNLSDNISGVSNLNKTTREIDGENYFEWLIPPQIAQTAGVIEFSISCYDLDSSNKIAFAWNTSKNRSLVIGESQTFLGTKNDSIQLPPKNQILLVHDNKQIIAPKEYNNLIGLYGDKGTGKIYFKCKQNIAGIDLLHEDTNIKVLVNFEDATYPDDGIQINTIETNSEFVLLTWSVPDWVTANENEYIGTIKIGLVFTAGDKCWRSASYSSLRIGESLVKDSDQAASAPTFEEEVTTIVNDVIENNDEIGRANWEQTDENGKGYIENKPLIKTGKNNYATEIGIRTQAGCNAFNIIKIEPYGYRHDTKPTKMLLTLDSVQFLQNGDVCSIIVDSNYMNFGTIIAINGQTITVDNYPETLTAAILDKTTLRDLENSEKTKPYLFIADKQIVLIGEEEYPVGTVSIDNGQIAEGIDSKALLRASHAEGDSTTAAGRYSHAEGSNTYAGYAAHAEGQNSKAIGNVSHAEGGQTTASGLYSHTEGQHSTASGNHSHAEGYQTTAEGNRAHAEGYKTSATGTDSHSEGNMTYAYGVASHAEGGGSTTANGDYSHAEGYGSKALRGYSHAEGYQSTAKGVTSHSEGHKSVAHSKYAHAEGLETHAGDEGSEEQVAAEKDSGAHAEGRYTHANGQASHAEGNGTYATGSHSHAEGTNSRATFARAHAEGHGTEASADSAHAEGKDTISEGNYAHAEGEGTVAHSLSQHAQGRYNIIDTKGNNSNKGTYAHIVGNGINKDNRSNAHTLDWDGNAWFAGEVRVGGTKYDDGKKLATEEFVRKLSLQQGKDGKLYLALDGTTFGDGIVISGVIGSVVGYVDGENNIILTGNLDDGEYNIQYKQSNGDYTEIGGLTIDNTETPEAKPLNLLTIAVDGNGNKGNQSELSNDGFYTEAKRIRYLYGNMVLHDQSRTTGFIPVKQNDIICFKNIPNNYNTSESVPMIAFYKSYGAEPENLNIKHGQLCGQQSIYTNKLNNTPQTDSIIGQHYEVTVDKDIIQFLEGGTTKPDFKEIDLKSIRYFRYCCPRLYAATDEETGKMETDKPAIYIKRKGKYITSVSELQSEAE